MRGRSARLARRRREQPESELMLAAMVDMMINILLFLLQLYGNSAITVQTSPDLSLARSASEDPIRYAVSVVVSRREVLVSGVPVSRFPEGNRPPETEELAQIGEALGVARASAAEHAAETGKPEPSEVILQVDRNLPWEQLGPVLRVVGDAGFANVRFAVASAPKTE